MPLSTTGRTLNLDASLGTSLYSGNSGGGVWTGQDPANGSSIAIWDNSDATFACGAPGDAPTRKTAYPSAVRFNGISNLIKIYNRLTSGSPLPLGNFINNNAFTLYSVFTLTSDPDPAPDGSGITFGSLGYFGQFALKSGGNYFARGNIYDGSNHNVDIGIAFNTLQVIAYRFDGSTMKIRNGTGSDATTSSGNVGNVAAPTLNVGCAYNDLYPFPGDIHELAYYNIEVTGTTLTDDINFLISKWTTPPSTGGKSSVGGFF